MSTLFLETDDGSHDLLCVEGYDNAPWAGPVLWVVNVHGRCYGPFTSRDDATLMLNEFDPVLHREVQILSLHTKRETRDILATTPIRPERLRVPEWWMQRRLSNAQRAFFEVTEEETPDRAWWMDVDCHCIPETIRDRLTRGCPECSNNIDMDVYVTSGVPRQVLLEMSCSDEDDCDWTDSWVVPETESGRSWTADHLHRWIELMRMP